MSDVDLNQLELLARVETVMRQAHAWADAASTWQPICQAQSLMRRVLERTDSLRVRLEAPLVVATFGGTGTGKSSLVNALVGADVTRSGRQRPSGPVEWWCVTQGDTNKRVAAVAHEDERPCGRARVDRECVFTPGLTR